MRSKISSGNGESYCSLVLIAKPVVIVQLSLFVT